MPLTGVIRFFISNLNVVANVEISPVILAQIVPAWNKIVSVKITSWNVNGLRALLNKGLWQNLVNLDSDVICLQEIKVRPDQLLDENLEKFSDWNVVWHPAEKLGYSGVVTLSQASWIDTRIGIGEDRFDREGRAICTRFPGFLLFNVYFPSGQRGYERVSFKLDFYARLLELCNQLHSAGEQIVICGDFNTAHQEIDLRYPKQNIKTSGFLPEERVWVDYYLQNGFADAFRELYPDKAQYTWWTYRLNARSRNIGWRLDYFLVSRGLMDRVQDVSIHESILGSDHCPVSLNIQI
jgi:exodeoxyribonuclease III